MITNNKSCINCIKKDVCKIKEKYEAFLEEVRKIHIGDMNISININCNSYYEYPLFKLPDITTPNNPYPLIDIKPNDAPFKPTTKTNPFDTVIYNSRRD